MRKSMLATKTEIDPLIVPPEVQAALQDMTGLTDADVRAEGLSFIAFTGLDALSFASTRCGDTGNRPFDAKMIAWIRQKNIKIVGFGRVDDVNGKTLPVMWSVAARCPNVATARLLDERVARRGGSMRLEDYPIMKDTEGKWFVYEVE